MQATVTTADLTKALTIAGRAVASRNTLPVLGNFLLSAEAGHLKVSATDLSMQITAWIGAIITRDGALTVPAKTLNDLVRASAAAQLDLIAEPGKTTLTLKAAKARSNIKGIDAAEFPQPLHLDADEAIALPSTAFADAVRMVVFAAATDESRPVLTGVQLSIKGDLLTMTATDGFRLARRSIRLDAPIKLDYTAVIPSQALAEVARVLEADQPLLMHAAKENTVIFRSGNVEVRAQLIEGKFPDLGAVIPKNCTTRTTVPVHALRQACASSEVFAREAGNTARFRIVPPNGDVPAGDMSPGSIQVRGTSAETGDAAMDVEATVDGPALEIAFNIRFFGDVLKVANGQIVLETTAPASPGKLTVVGDDDYLYVIMPMHMG